MVGARFGPNKPLRGFSAWEVVSLLCPVDFWPAPLGPVVAMLDVASFSWFHLGRELLSHGVLGQALLEAALSMQCGGPAYTGAPPIGRVAIFINSGMV
jgi:hypothetical protein